jgi:L-threonylcarbamoyladenylate synthase
MGSPEGEGGIAEAARILRAGGVVAFPTETVYGLGADAGNAEAIARVFRIKGRPSTNPLICHVADEAVARRCARDWPLAASRIATAFWPGPITVVVCKTDAIVSSVTAGLHTVGLRVPNHPLALEMLRAFGGPVAAPSANRSSRVSPTAAQHVRDELGDGVDLILDGGPCTVGIESTVLDLSRDVPRVLRPGAVTREMIESTLGMRFEVSDVQAEPSAAQTSPGQLAVHYAPRTPAFRFEPRERDRIDLTDAAILELALDPDAYARQLYARLRMLDAQNLRAIYIELPPDLPQWRAVRDRILRATRPLASC